MSVRLPTFFTTDCKMSKRYDTSITDLQLIRMIGIELESGVNALSPANLLAKSVLFLDA